MLMTTLGTVAMGFGLGLLHALDADHVMAVSALSTRKPGFLKTLYYSFHWALGHSGVLLLAGLLLFGLGMQIPQALQHIAEVSVGVVLMGLGVACLIKFKRQKVRLRHHRHGDVEHTHWHMDGDENHNGHAPVMVGMLHGLAGSAPALAVIPAVAQTQLFSAMGYLGLFSLGVLCSMVLFGCCLGALQLRLQNKGEALFNGWRYFMASASVFIGAFWVFQAY